ncbi:MAG: CCA tRNA nucleotidyltransferase [Verrucomicrobia bacterium]|nr:CCA tRNA nucleotidyltransferase [Verrucomicrobiota bacterium]MBU4246938.1 CCA tRNA nucleotidyltransferase [Verrucomicrobiota bacterium]MBU4291354.1 CCA tRNA nucleotidyltransferase [Verrucomicrobiota bacterium]MBU4498069.1 CCA tRNA nucleotidyltransferase [Verrucomicrobiota bacterium]MCG2680056.1 CCA tRNA nucleotidyltransferase [Kiritimatiellia bacterium]
MDHRIPTPLSDGAHQVAQRLQAAGFSALWAGGCVRDMIMGRAPKDYDLATNATPERVMALFPRAIAVGKAFGVVRVAIGGLEYEVATFRKDHAYKDGRHPEAVSYTDEKTDAQRRDFTVNALFFDPLAGKVHDYVNGQADITARVIRAVGHPNERFEEDHLRMLRAIRFASTLDFTLDTKTFEAIRTNAQQIGKISVERIQQELTRILLESARSGDAIGLMLKTGLLQVFLPEVAAMLGQAQPPQFHPEGDVFTHTMLMLNAMQKPSLRLAYAVLLHDVGKPMTAKLTDGRIRFNQHASHGATMAETILKRLRLPSEDIKAIVFSIGNHMRFMDVRKMRRATLHRLVGAPTFPLELELHRLDCAACHGDMQNFDFLTEFQRECRAKPVLPKPWVTGADILALGVPSGREVGRWKKLAYDAQLEKAVAHREAALAWLKKLITAKRAKSA